MGSSTAMAESSTFVSNFEWSYDVFLSFRGEDTRYNFTSHLNMALQKVGVNVFIDDKLNRGEQISESLFRFIEKALISIVIFSENYASSSWCLDELVKIIECKKFKGQIVWPIFYKVDPSDIRKQTGSFGEALATHQAKFKTKVQIWREALTFAANLSGWHLGTRKEADLIQDLVRQVLSILNHTCTPSSVAKYPIGIDSQLKRMVSCSHYETQHESSTRVYMVGIYGIGGIGKTTLANALYNNIANQFEACCFLSDVREASKQFNGLVKLQESLLHEVLKEDFNVGYLARGVNIIRSRLRSKKVLIVLDDVDELKQLDNLVGGHDWFGPDSKIIVTTRNKHLLDVHKFDQKYDIQGMDHDDALELFSWHAFKKSYSPSNYLNLSERATRYCKGLPLALEVLGSFLCDRKDQAEWISILDKFENSQDKTIQDILQISFDGLEKEEKEIFLDISCLLVGEKVDYLKKILNACHDYPDGGIIKLMDFSLITIENAKVQMHDLIRQMGHKIVHDESSEPEKRSRLWLEKDILKVLNDNSGTDAVKAMKFYLPNPTRLDVDPRAFRNMKNLRLLIFQNVGFSKKPKYLPDNLKWIKWHGFPHRSLPFCFFTKNLVGLDLEQSRIRYVEKGLKDCPKLKFVDFSFSPSLEKIPKFSTKLCLEFLTVLNLSYCYELKKLSDFSGASNLEELYLNNCINLREIHESIGSLDKLVTLNLSRCSKLKKLPNYFRLKSLKVLNLKYCKKLEKLPDCSGASNLKELDLEECTNLRMIHESIGFLDQLVTLECSRCSNLKKLPKCFMLKSLEVLSFYGCKKLEEVPDFSGASNLEKLFLSDCTNLREIHESIGYLDSLVTLYLPNCTNLKKLPSYFMLKSLKVLNLNGCKKLEELPDFSGASNLEMLCLVGCTNLREIHMSIGYLDSLVTLYLDNCTNLVKFSSFLKLKSLKKLDLSYCCKFEMFSEIDENMKSLERLDLSFTAIRELPSSIGYLTNLNYLGLDGCKNLFSLPNTIYSLPNLPELCHDGCSRFELFPRKWGPAIHPVCSSSKPMFSNLFELNLENCNISNADFLETLCDVIPFLCELDLSENNFSSLPSCLHNFKSLGVLNLRDCKFLQQIPNLPPCIQEMDATGSLARSPDNIVDIILSELILPVGSSKLIILSEQDGWDYKHFFLMNGEIQKRMNEEIVEKFSYHTISNPMKVSFRHYLNTKRTLAAYVTLKVEEHSYEKKADISFKIGVGNSLKDSSDVTFPPSTSEYTWLVSISSSAFDTSLVANDWNDVIVWFDVSESSSTIAIKSCGVHLTEVVHEIQNDAELSEVTYTDFDQSEKLPEWDK